MFPMRPCLRAVLGCAGLVLAAPAFCQLIPLTQGLTPVPAPKPAGLEWRHPHGLLYFNTNIGSFKLVSNADDPSEGTLDFIFKGTVLISDMDPASRLVLNGNIRK